MWPWAHAAVGYLLYSLSLHHRDARPPSGGAAVAVGVGTLAPDLVDKPLAWYAGVLPTGRSLTHSLLVVVPVALVLAWVLARRGHAETGRALAVGLVSHPLADALHPLVSGEWVYLSFLGWPLLPSPEYDGPESVLARLRMLEMTPFFAFELLVTAAAIALWAGHGYPGLGTLRSWGRVAVS